MPTTTGHLIDSPTDISVVVVSWNARKYLEECLGSLSEGVNRSCEIIVVDNASADGSPEMVARHFPHARLILTGENLGFAKANNLGIRRSSGKYIALINSDVRVLPGCLDRLATFLDENPSVGMVGPRIMNGDKSQQYSCRYFPNLWNNFCQSFGINKLFPRSSLFSGEQMSHFAYDRIQEVEVLSGCFILARRKAVDAFGYLDESFWMYGEDVDWSRQCSMAGWQVVFNPQAEAIHYGGGSSANNPIRFEVAQQHARLLLFAKHRATYAQLGLAVLIIVHRCLRITATAFNVFIGTRKRAKAVKIIRAQLACMYALLRWWPLRSTRTNDRTINGRTEIPL